MLSSGTLNKAETRYALGVFTLVVIVLFVNLGIYPLFLEEPRRGLIGLEMIFNDNIWVPTQTGDLYFRKPPVYNWALILSYKLFGEYSEFATRVVSVSSFVIMGVATFLFSRKRLGFEIAAISTLGVLTAADILFYFSTLGEIDLFYSLITVLSFFALYHFGERGEWYRMFVIVYALSAVGLLTKGLSSVPFLGISILCYLGYAREWKQLFRPAHFLGIAVFLAMAGGYFWMYSQYEDPMQWWETLFNESAGRANSGIFDLLKHLVEFPIENLKNLLPVALLVPIVVGKGFFQRVRENRLVAFLLLLALANFLVYWLSAEAKSRYVYALYPLVTIAFTYLAFRRGERKWHGKYWNILARVMLTMGAVLTPLVPFSGVFDVVPHIFLITAVILGMFGLLWWLHLKKAVRPFLIIIGMAVVARTFFSLTIPVVRAETTGAAWDRQFAYEVADTTAGSSLQRYGNVRISLSIVYYLEAAREAVLTQTNVWSPGFFLCYEEDLPDLLHEEVAIFDYNGRPVYLIEIVE